MRAAERCVLEILGIPAGALGTGAGRKMRHGRPLSGLRCSHDLPFQIVSLPLGGGVPPLQIWESFPSVKEVRWHATVLIAGEPVLSRTKLTEEQTCAHDTEKRGTG